MTDSCILLKVSDSMPVPLAASKSSNKYSLHIPRASLSPGSSSCSGSSSRSREFSPNPADNKIAEMADESETEAYHNNAFIDDERNRRKWRQQSHHSADDGNEKISRKPNHPMYIVYKAGKPQRKLNVAQSPSSSSSSSAASNQSSNCTVNTLLQLSVKNLEHFNRNVKHSNGGGNGIESRDGKQHVGNSQNDEGYRRQMMSNLKNTVAIDMKHGRKKKEPDQLSTTSSATNTNFTVITFNGFGKSNRKKSRAICRRRHQVTILIIIMTCLLFIGIFGAVCALEMRFQKMPR